MTRTIRPLAASILPVAVFCACLCGCGGAAETEPIVSAPSAPASSPSAPSVLEGTVAEAASLAGGGGLQVKGYGLVVGLGEKGSSEVPPAIRRSLIADMTRRGVNKPLPDGSELDLARLIDDRDTAVVAVSAWIPAGTPEGTRLDVTASALPGTQTTSLDGGVLYETELRTFEADESGVRESYRVELRAAGAIFVNPFVERGDSASAPKLRTGQIVGGGVTTQSRPVWLVLEHPDYRTARVIRDAINERWPGVPKAANAKSPSLVELRIPRQMRGDYGHFLDLVTHLYLRRGPEVELAKARRLAEQILEPDAPLEEISLIWEAMGKHVVDAFRALYASENPSAAYYAARAGLRLGDRAGLEVLARTAADAASPYRLAAVAELGRSVDAEATLALAKLLDEDDAIVRVAAYEALTRGHAGGPVVRHDVDGKFFVDTVETGGDFLIYATRSGEAKLVFFGGQIPVRRPIMFTSADGELTVHARKEDERLRLYRVVGAGDRRLLSDELEVPFDAASVAEAMGRRPAKGKTGEFRGLGLTYSQVVGAMYRLCRKDAAQWIPAEFMLQRPGAAETMLSGTAIEGRPDTAGGPE